MPAPFPEPLGRGGDRGWGGCFCEGFCKGDTKLGEFGIVDHLQLLPFIDDTSEELPARHHQVQHQSKGEDVHLHREEGRKPSHHASNY